MTKALQTSILLAEDDAVLRDFVCRNLRARGFAVFEASNGLEALALWEMHQPGLFILDVMMPRLDGLSVCKRIREKSTAPIIVLTALDSDADKIAALDFGADDYLTKPFAVGELLARVRAVLRRSQWSARPSENASVASDVIRHGDIELNQDSREVFVRGAKANLTRVEFDLLALLMSRPNKVMPHRALLQRVWGDEYGDELEYLRVYVNRLRRKIEPDPANPKYLMNELGVGYKFSIL